MEDLQSFLSMGGYAEFVWPAYALSALVLGGILIHSLRRLRETERELSSLNIGDDESKS